MIFNQFEFLFLFLPAVLALFFAPPLRHARLDILLVASLVFYGISGLEHLIVLVIEILWVYAATASPSMRGNQARLALAAIPPVLALVYYKYTAFLVRDVLGLGPAEHQVAFDLFTNIVLPAGISFFTFHLVSFAIDRYRGTIDPGPSLRALALYTAFFPQLVAGPILRFNQVRESIRNLAAFHLTAPEAAKALGYIVFGLAAKVLIADTLGHDLKPFTAAPATLDPISALYVVFGYSFQIYFDFYGYSLTAIGLGLLFGFTFPDNFLRPYSAPNPREFWRRWHTTLSYWLRDYLYIPLGGNESYRRNILIVFAICGLWHGAGWTFVVWGLYHATLVIGYHETRFAWDRMPHTLQVALTFILVSLGWTLFQFDFPRAVQFAKSLVGLGTATAPAPTLEMWLALAAAFAVAYLAHFERAALAAERTARRAIAYSAGLGALAVLTLMFVDRSEGFIYFRF